MGPRETAPIPAYVTQNEQGGFFANLSHLKLLFSFSIRLEIR